MASITDHRTAEIPASDRGRDVSFALGIVAMLVILFIPLPPALIDMGLALSIALSVLILMVALWIQKPIEFSSFPTILLVATMLRLSLNIATTRVILTHGQEGEMAAGGVIAGFANFVMGGDFVIGTVVFVILLTVNFLVITKGASRIAEVAARFSLDAMPGKQMAIDADLAAGLIDEKDATRRRRELEEESAFYGAMDGASKFVRGDAIAGLIITGVNVFGGVVIGVLRHDMTLAKSFDIYTKLSVGDGLVTQIPALIVSLGAGLLVSKGGTRGSAQSAVIGQLGSYPRALGVAGALLALMAVAPGLPFVPFALLGTAFAALAFVIPRRVAEATRAAAQHKERAKAAAETSSDTLREQLRAPEIELCLGRQIASVVLKSNTELAQRVAKMRRKFARIYGFVLPEVKVSDVTSIGPKQYQIKVHGTTVASGELRPGDLLVVVGDGPLPSVPGDEVREPAFGMRALWTSEMFSEQLKREGFAPIDGMSVMLTHLAEVLRNHLGQMLSYKDMRALLDRLDPEYRRLTEEICPSQISYSGLQAVLKMLLAERISIRNLNLILEAVAEIAPFVRKAEAIAEHVRVRISPQICGDLADGDTLKILRLGNRWELAFHQALKRDAKGEIVEFNMEPNLIEAFSNDLSRIVRRLMDEGHAFVIVTSADARPFVRMVTERLFPTLSVLSHVEISRGALVRSMGSVS